MRTLLLLALAFGCQSSPTIAPLTTADSAVADASVDAAPDVAVDAPAPAAPLRVLFIGNSYTYVNDLPALIARMGDDGARTGGPRITVDSVTVGGATLADHWLAQNAPMRLMAGGWSAVVLQGQSVEPAIGAANFRTYAVRFGEAAVAVSARPVYYATWPRRAGDPLYDEAWSGGTPEALNMRLDQGYTSAAMQVGGVTAHVGNAWLQAIRTHPAINLYDPDGSHPSPAGTWLTGCVMYRTLTGLDAPSGLDGALAGVTADDARALRESVRAQ